MGSRGFHRSRTSCQFWASAASTMPRQDLGAMFAPPNFFEPQGMVSMLVAVAVELLRWVGCHVA